MKRRPIPRHQATEAELRAAHATSAQFARFPFERVMANEASALAIRKLAEIRARRVPAAPEAFQLTP